MTEDPLYRTRRAETRRRARWWRSTDPWSWHPEAPCRWSLQKSPVATIHGCRPCLTAVVCCWWWWWWFLFRLFCNLQKMSFSPRGRTKGFPMVFPAGRLRCRLWLGLLVGDLPPCTAARFVEMDGIYNMANPTITPDGWRLIHPLSYEIGFSDIISMI